MCGAYLMTPGAVGDLTPGEIMTMLDGADYASDRRWEMALFQKTTDTDAARDLWAYNYPKYKQPRVLSVRRGSRKRKR